MPFTVILFIVSIILIALGFAAAMTRSDQRFKLERDRLQAEAGGNSLPTSELKALIQDAMEEVIAPLDARLELMERQLRRLPPAETGPADRKAVPDEDRPAD